jgi:urate oxidase
MPVLGWNRYGKSRVRLVKVRRQSQDAPHELVDLTIDVQLEGAFDAVYVEGDNAPCVATDTMKNTVYALARQNSLVHVEAFAGRLADHFMAKPAVARVTVSAVEHRWDRLGAHAFVQPGGEQWTVVVTRDAGGSSVVSGLTNLVVLKTADSLQDFRAMPTRPCRRRKAYSRDVRHRGPTVSRRHDRFCRPRSVRAALVDTFAARQPFGAAHAVCDGRGGARCRDRRHHLTMPNGITCSSIWPFGLDPGMRSSWRPTSRSGYRGDRRR